MSKLESATLEEKKEAFLKALEVAGGVVQQACNNMGVSRPTYYRWCAEDESFRQRCKDVEEMQIDFVEGCLMKKVMEGDTASIIFYLKTKGKKRGWTEKPLPAEQKDGQPKVVNTTNIYVASVTLVKEKEEWLTTLLKEGGKYRDEWKAQISLAAKLLADVDVLDEQRRAPGYQPIKVEYSREGNRRETKNTVETLYVEKFEECQKALRRLGMNNDSKDKITDNDTFSDFMEKLTQDSNDRDREEDTEAAEV